MFEYLLVSWRCASPDAPVQCDLSPHCCLTCDCRWFSGCTTSTRLCATMWSYTTSLLPMLPCSTTYAQTKTSHHPPWSQGQLIPISWWYYLISTVFIKVIMPNMISWKGKHEYAVWRMFWAQCILKSKIARSHCWATSDVTSWYMVDSKWLHPIQLEGTNRDRCII